MTDLKKNYYSTKDVLVFMRSYMQYLSHRWKWIVLVVALAAISASVYFFLQPRRYVANCSFILEEKQSGVSGLSGIASQFGFDLGSLGSGGNLFGGDNILDIFKSKKIIYEVLLSDADTDSAAVKGKTLADMFIGFSGWKQKWKSDPLLNNMSFGGSADKLSARQDSVLSLVHKSLLKKNITVERQSKKGTIITVQVVSPNAVFSRVMTERMVSEAKDLYLEIKVGNAMRNISQLQKKADSLIYLLNSKSYSVAAAQQLDVNPAIKTLVVPTEIGTREKSVLAALYAEVVKNLEASKMMMIQQTPAIQVLDEPERSPKDQSPGLIKLNALAVLIAGFGFALIAFISFFISKNLS